MPHDDEVFEEEEFWTFSEDEEEPEVEPEKKKEATKVPPSFFDEEAGPPEVDPEFLQELDDEATEKEIRRLTKMEVIELVATEKEESTSRIPFADTVKEKFKWLTTKLVKDWRWKAQEWHWTTLLAETRAPSCTRT